MFSLETLRCLGYRGLYGYALLIVTDEIQNYCLNKGEVHIPWSILTGSVTMESVISSMFTPPLLLPMISGP